MWSSWKKCTKTCGTGSKTRNRSCINPKPQNGGANCDLLGPKNDTKACNIPKCYEGKGTNFVGLWVPNSFYFWQKVLHLTFLANKPESLTNTSNTVNQTDL